LFLRECVSGVLKLKIISVGQTMYKITTLGIGRLKYGDTHTYA